MDKVIAYCSVETNIKDSRVIELQKQKITKYAKSHNLEIVEWFDQIGYVPITFPYSRLDDALEYCKESPEVKNLLVADSLQIALAVDVFYFWKTAFERIGVTIVSIDDPDRSQYLPMPSELEDLDSQKRSGLIRKYMAEEGTLKLDDLEIINAMVQEENYKWYASLTKEEKKRAIPGLNEEEIERQLNPNSQVN